jgi:hypothetical protein
MNLEERMPAIPSGPILLVERRFSRLSESSLRLTSQDAFSDHKGALRAALTNGAQPQNPFFYQEGMADWKA